jgi:hypothetical protein
MMLLCNFMQVGCPTSLQYGIWQGCSVIGKSAQVCARRQARRTIARLHEETPNLTRRVIEATWDACLQDASDQAEAETDQPIASPTLSWEEVFDTPYTVERSPEHYSEPRTMRVPTVFCTNASGRC